MLSKQSGTKITLALGALAVGAGLLGTAYAESSGDSQSPSYRSSIRVPDQAGGEKDEATQLAALAKIDAKRASSAALAKVPGTVLQVGLDNENGNLVYGVEIKTASNEVKDVKIDAGNGAVLHMDAADNEENEEE
ncbi:PepSY domain-containing protein [Burkholderia pseudomultivorans]|uniref:PepSY domain-containing protein n=1 Tax=Burkholderia pseudomultivorans TaxID=1207504 RepID=UPI0028769000|nr:PepSY domain-containing protein [Burkholderia pseudomultivorans]MDS0859811.1 PepSY domain-containing protein [Burkholderia pseudomultivorans]